MVVEFGAWDGIYISNTYQLWAHENFNALLIESDFKRYKQLYKFSKKFIILNNYSYQILDLFLLNFLKKNPYIKEQYLN